MMITIADSRQKKIPYGLLCNFQDEAENNRNAIQMVSYGGTSGLEIILGQLIGLKLALELYANSN